jgi:hypothetical protein
MTIAENEAKAAARCGMSLDEWRKDNGAQNRAARLASPLHAQRIEFEKQRTARESARLYDGKTWDGKYWRNRWGFRIRPPVCKPSLLDRGETAVQIKGTQNEFTVSWGNVVVGWFGTLSEFLKGERS